VSQSREFGSDWSAALRRGSDAELHAWVDAALGWCDETDAIAMRHFRAQPHTSQKPDGSFVTAADKAVEALLVERIGAAFPAHAVIGEEGGRRTGSESVSWTIDPIDGTHNYLRGLPIFATLIAVSREGELQAGVMSAPAIRTRWYAWRGGGAWVIEHDTQPRGIRVSAIAKLGDASLSTSSIAELEAAAVTPGFATLARAVWRERGYGDFWSYALLADGALDAMVETDLSAWDIAAPAIVVEEAGGRVTNLDGRRDFGGGAYLATNGILHETIRTMLVQPEGGSSA
jgi:histidinol-phosphatase